ncbi:rRNA pseudouridine synthase [Candidatus Berkelbacteria bacterium]|nr:rRNA pseudouridine synthase [Candidatus Berkelbacteria bacterium]
MSNHIADSRSSKTRLNKFIAQSGLCSRRQADQLIAEQRVRVNGRTASTMGLKVGLNDLVEVDGNVIKAVTKYETYALYKPVGVISSRASQGNSKTIYDFVKTKQRLFSIGRLDKDSEGLIILTTDGQAAQRLAHPRFQTKKTYQIWLEIPNRYDLEEMIKKLSQAHTLDGKRVSLEGIRYLGRDQGYLRFSLVLTQGLNHQIRRLVGRAGFTVKRLMRISHGPVTLDGLKPGQSKRIDLEV